MKTNRSIEEIVTTQFSKNPHRSVSACYRSIRKHNRFYGQGDYTILANIVSAIYKTNLTPSKHQILYAFNQSTELSELSRGMKTKLLEQLLELSSAATKRPEISQGQTKNQKIHITSSKKENY